MFRNFYRCDRVRANGWMCGALHATTIARIAVRVT